MHHNLLDAARSEFEKVALNRYERALQTGEIDAPHGANSLQHTLQPGYASPPTAAPSYHPADPQRIRQKFLQESRNEMWGPGKTDLTPEQLTRHRQLQGLQANQAAKSLGAHNVSVPMLGPVTIGQHVMVGDNAGSFVRNVADGHYGRAKAGTFPAPVRKYLAAPSITANPDVPSDVDNTIRHAIIQHEGGEKALSYGADHARTAKKSPVMDLMRGAPKEDLALPARPISGHFGAMPLLEEKRVTWRDPEAQQIFQKVRAQDADDSYVEKLHRQFGGRPDAPIAIGSPQHAEIERRVAARMPEVGAAIQKRVALAPAGMSHGLPADQAEAMGNGLGGVLEHLYRPAAPTGSLRGRVLDWAKKRGEHNVLRAVTSVSDPADLPQRLMRLRAAVRH